MLCIRCPKYYVISYSKTAFCKMPFYYKSDISISRSLPSIFQNLLYLSKANIPIIVRPYITLIPSHQCLHVTQDIQYKPIYSRHLGHVPALITYPLRFNIIFSYEDKPKYQLRENDLILEEAQL